MTIDDLTRLAMREAQDFRNKMLVTGQPYSPHDEYYVFTRSIVRALRDEMTLGWEDDRPWGDVADVKKFLNKILASDAGEKVAGGSTREDGLDCNPVGARPQDALPTPATDAGYQPDLSQPHPSDAAPAVCEISTHFKPIASTHCHTCGKPIKFTEAKHG